MEDLNNKHIICSCGVEIGLYGKKLLDNVKCPKCFISLPVTPARIKEGKIAYSEVLQKTQTEHKPQANAGFPEKIEQVNKALEKANDIPEPSITLKFWAVPYRSQETRNHFGTEFTIFYNMSQAAFVEIKVSKLRYWLSFFIGIGQWIKNIYLAFSCTFVFCLFAFIGIVVFCAFTEIDPKFLGYRYNPHIFVVVTAIAILHFKWTDSRESLMTKEIKKYRPDWDTFAVIPEKKWHKFTKKLKSTMSYTGDLNSHKIQRIYF